MIPDREWVREWMKKREMLSAEVDFEQYFSQEEVGGVFVQTQRLGLCPVPTGSLLVRDPTSTMMDRAEQPYFVTAPVGKYPLEAAIVHTNESEPLCAAARLIFNYQPAVHYEQALTGEEDIENFDGGYYGFYTQNGLGCVCDERTHQLFCDFVQRWQQQNPDGDLYEDYFAPMISGAFLRWTIPGTSCHVPIFRTGWGEGDYPVYWGQDEENRVCQLVIWFMDLESEQNQQEEEDFDEGQSSYIIEEDLPQEWWYESGFCQGEICLRNWEAFFGCEQRYPLMIRMDEAEEAAEELAVQAGEWLLKEQYRVLDTMMIALTDRYPLLQLEYGHVMADNVPEMPNIRDKNDFCTLLYPQRILVEPDSGKVAVAFSCSWDEEEGLGIVVCGEKALEIGTAQIVPEWTEPPVAQPEDTEEYLESEGQEN